MQRNVNFEDVSIAWLESKGYEYETILSAISQMSSQMFAQFAAQDKSWRHVERRR